MNKQKLSTKRTNNKYDSKFKTDSDISNAKFTERELTRWVPDESDKASLDFDENNNSSNWDQFKVNQEKFGVESSYDEHLYTTRINTNAKDYTERVKRAEQLAKEIENDNTNDPHILEERGVILDSNLDEEMKYSGVVRDDEELPKKDTRGEELMAALKSMKVTPSASKQLSDSNPHAEPSPKDKNPKDSYRLNAQSEFNSLKEFSATFKVPHKLPNDLLPILAKDKSKQDEILKKSSSTTETQPKKDSKFKLNPKAQVFTPIGKSTHNSPKPQQTQSAKAFNGSNNRSSNNPSPRMTNQRPYSAGSSNSSKRHYQISPADFFGQDKVPTKESQLEKSARFKKSFCFFTTVKSKVPKGETVHIERAYITPPTWDQTVDEPHYALFPPPDKMPTMMSPFMMGMPPQMNMMPGAFSPQSDGSPIPNQMPMPVSPNMTFQQQQQQQQFQAMMYQQQFGMVPQPMFIPNQDYGANFVGNGYRGGYYSNGNGNNRRYQKRNSNH